MIEFGHVPEGFRVKDLSGDTSPHTYTPPYSAESLYFTKYGVWRYNHGRVSWEFTKDSVRQTNYRPVIIRECGIPEMKGRHYDMLIEDDMPSSISTVEDAKKAIRWHKMQTQYHLKPEFMKEVKNKMLQLIDVIFFNSKDKKIDFRKDIVAVDVEEAYMLAAQEYGKYDSKVHMRHAVCLFSFCDDSKE
jgi:hypothetical protein